MQLGERHPDHLIGHCPKDAPLNSRQLSEWLAYYNIHPFGDYRDDIRAAAIRHSIAASVGAKVDFSKLIIPEVIGVKKTNEDKRMMQLRFMAWANSNADKSDKQ